MPDESRAARMIARASALATTSSTRARPARTGVKLVRVGRFDQPLYVTAPPGDKRRLFVVPVRVLRC